jgi:hypothetical protein
VQLNPREVNILSTTRNRSHFAAQPRQRLLAAALILVAATPFAMAQTARTAAPPENLLAVNATPELPNSPGFSSSVDAANLSEDPADPQARTSAPPPNARTKNAPHLEMTIAPNEIASPMPVHDKIVGGLKDSVSLYSAVGWVVSAGWTQLTNGSPNYGTDKGAFGQRLGAAAVRNISEDIFANCLFAPVFHEDPRYYIMGRGNNIFKRAIYAGTRVIVTRTDGGHATPNFALLAGNAAGAALTVTYYPAKNTSFSEVAQTFGGSVGGSALGFVVSEFLGDALEFAHLKKKD